MKIAIAADSAEHVSTHTGRSRGFAIYEIDKHEARRLEFRENTFKEEKVCPDHSSQHARQGDLPHLHDTLMQLLSDCSVLIARGAGQRLVYDLQSQGVETFLCETDDVAEAAQLFAQGQLRPLAGMGPCREV